MSSLQKRENPFEKKETTETCEQDNEIVRKGDFRNFSITEETIENLKNNGYKYLFPIQQATYEIIFEGHDLIGRDRTGSGKTLAFALPLLERLRKKNKHFSKDREQRPFILVLVPTRELAIQVTREFEKLKNKENELRILPVYGGTDINQQIHKLRAGVEVVIGTPGRVMDLQERRELNFSKIRAIVLDETDQMLNFGFQEDIEKILKKTKEDIAEENRKIDDIQFCLFSATIPKWVENIAAKFMKENVSRIDMVKDSDNKTSTTVEHLCMSFSDKAQKIAAIGDVVMVYGGAHNRTIIFTDTKEEANNIMTSSQLKIERQVLHGDIPQNQREITFRSFKSGQLKCLIATNIAARGLDIPEVDLVIQLSPPKDIDTYIHRSGRTGRAGKRGVCITFYSGREVQYLDKIEQISGAKLKKVGMPQPKDMVKSSARDVSKAFAKVSDSVLPSFGESVKDLLQIYKPEEALARAFAIISGYTNNMQQRSLLSSAEGYVTYIIENDQEVRALTFFWSLLNKNIDPHIVNSIKDMRFLANRCGAVFDLPENFKTQLDEIIAKLNNRYVKVYVAKELPELEDNNLSSSFNGFNDKKKGNNERNNQGYDNKNRNNQRDNSRSTFNNRGNDNWDSKTDFDWNTQNNKKNDSYDNKADYNWNNQNSKSNDNIDNTKLFVTNLSESVQDKDLHALFGAKGFIPEDVYIIKNQDGTSKGFGYIRFTDSFTAKAAMDSLNCSDIKGKQLKISYANKKKD